MAKDFVKLLGEGGEARKYFSDATGGAPWVNAICDEIVDQLKKNYVYLTIDDPLTDMFDRMFARPEVQGFTLWRLEDGKFQANYSWQNRSTWDVAIVYGAGDAVTTALSRALSRP